jgi:K+/H+ antiporter YhaU regulatory subunit KhtT
MLGDKCCFNVNKSEEAQNNIKQILEKTRDLNERATKGWLSWEGTWLSPFLGTLLIIH